jgi:RimJ/RimL family protein N-acetyltransferase
VKLSVRELREEDIPFIVRYWTEASPADLERMGADAAKVPAAPVFTASLRGILATPVEERKNSYSIWLAGGRAIGFSSLKNIVFGQRGEMHLHMWDPGVRGKGYGPVLFCLSTLDYYRLHDLKEIICEPRAINPFPNKMFQKIGFPLVKTHTAASSELSLVCELNRYAIRLEDARRFLAKSP